MSSRIGASPPSQNWASIITDTDKGEAQASPFFFAYDLDGSLLAISTSRTSSAATKGAAVPSEYIISERYGRRPLRQASDTE
jgi:hypothetical protein